MSQPVIIWRRWDADRELTVLRVDVSYVPSFCQHLENRGIRFTRSEAINDEWGMDKENKRWNITTNEIALSGLLGPDDILPGWEIPQQGL